MAGKKKTWRRVVSSELRSGTTGLIRLTHSYWWELELECGCTVERNVRYTPPKQGERSGGLRVRGRARGDIMDPPKKVHCKTCQLRADREGGDDD